MNYITFITDYINGVPYTQFTEHNTITSARTEFKRQVKAIKQLSVIEEIISPSDYIEYIDYVQFGERTNDGNNHHCVGILTKDELISSIEARVKEEGQLTKLVIDEWKSINTKSITFDYGVPIEVPRDTTYELEYIIRRPKYGKNFTHGAIYDIHTTKKQPHNTHYVFPLSDSPCEILAGIYNYLFC